MTASRREVVLLETNKPRQERAKRTYEAILAAAAELLVEAGVERISTNMIAERAGITVPALYRYFPNKYAVLHALGTVEMQRQSSVFEQWLERHCKQGSNPEKLLASTFDLLWRSYELTREQPGGLEIIQALRAVAPLQELRLTSHRLVARQLALLVAESLARPVDQAIAMQARLTVDTGYSLVEMALQEGSLPAEDILRQGAHMIQLYWRDILTAG